MSEVLYRNPVIEEFFKLPVCQARGTLFCPRCGNKGQRKLRLNGRWEVHHYEAGTGHNKYLYCCSFGKEYPEGIEIHV